MSDDTEKRIATLEAELAALKKAQEPKPEFKPKKPYTPIDYTAGFRLPADAAKAMAAIVPDVKGGGFDPNAWAKTKMYGPSGLGPSSRDRMRAMEEETRRRDREKMDRLRAEREAAQPKPGSTAAALAAWRRNNPVE